MDDLDAHLLRLLQANARMPVAELGRRIGLSRTATLARMRRLEDDGMIRGYHADVHEPSKAATHDARVGIVVNTVDMPGYIRRLTATFSEVREVESVAGEFDLLVRFAATSAQRLDEILDRLGGWRETVRTTTYVVLTRYQLP